MDASTILANLKRVAAERDRRRAEPRLAARVVAIKAFQHRRFEACYADLLATERYRAAARFFLNDLYGPHDFTDRDAQFARVVPALVRMFPASVVHTVRALSELHALSECLDSAMAEAMDSDQVDADRYGLAWRAVGRRDDRLRQMALMHEIGLALERFTKNPLLRHTLRMMRVPARASGLSALQKFLENGFDAFRSMRGAGVFLDTIRERETDLAEALFAPSGVMKPTGRPPVLARVAWPAAVVVQWPRE